MTKKATHRTAKQVPLASIIIAAHTDLDWSDGILRIPPESIQKLVDAGLVLALDPKSTAFRQIASDAQREGDEATAEMTAGIGKLNSALSQAVGELGVKFPSHGTEYAIERHKLEAAAYAGIDALQAARKATLKTIDARRLEKQAAL
jgi:hypothetical protein